MGDNNNNNTNLRRKSKSKQPATTGSDGGFPEESGGGEVWASFDETFRQVQSVLDRNRVLIQQVNENHQSRIPSNMVDNVALIQELNGNISKVVSIYSDFSSDFSTAFNAKRGAANQDA